jgi:hypothetical protein
MRARALSRTKRPLCLSILAVADPLPPIFTEEDLTQDIGAEILRLNAQLERLDARQAQDQVYRRLVFQLCSTCNPRWIEDPTGSRPSAPSTESPAVDE